MTVNSSSTAIAVYPLCPTHIARVQHIMYNPKDEVQCSDQLLDKIYNLSRVS